MRHRDFRLLWLGLAVSMTGSWMQSMAQGWLVLRLTDSPLALGLVGFSSYLPMLLFALPAGAAADMLPRRRALYWTQSCSLLQALVLAGLTWSGRVQPWHVAALAFTLGTASAFDIPIRQSVLLDLVGPYDLPNAIALNSLAFNTARFIGPALAGLLLSSWGEAPIFLVNALSYVAVLASLTLMRSDPPTERVARSWFGEIPQGVAHILADRPMRQVLTLVVIASVCAMPYSILLPVFARDVLAIGSRGLGAMMAAAGAGAMCGALFLAGRRQGLRTGRTSAVALAVVGAALIAFALSSHAWTSMALLVVIGGALIVQLGSSNTMLQLLSPPPLRGRIISLYMLSFMGMAPVGALLAGVSARAIGSVATVAVGGAACLAAALLHVARAEGARSEEGERGSV
jgi:MFS family permease